MKNSDIFNFYNDLKTLITSSQVPVGIAYFILKDLTNEVENLFYNVVNQENIEQANSQREFSTEQKEIFVPFNQPQQENASGQE